ncbi:MAG TPA: HflK protein, partial [Citreicella sp.]|nr:HflK protein [Citreicella sp.]
MAGHGGGPWGGGGNRGGNGRPPGGGGGGGKRPEDPQIPEIDELMKKGQERLRVLMGGRGGGANNGGGSGSGGGFSGGPKLTRGTIIVGALVAAGVWAALSFYTVRPEEQSVELFLGSYSSTGSPGLNFAPWPFVTHEVVNVTSERTETIGGGQANNSEGLMLTTDANIVDIEFQVVWNINDPAKVLFNIRDPQLTVQAVSEAVMREIIAASNL